VGDADTSEEEETTIGEVDKPSDEPPTVMSKLKKPPTRPHIIDVGDADTSEEEETDEMRGIGSSMSSRQQAAAVSQETGGWRLGIPYREVEVPVSLST
jgi:hypothetical protein